MSDPEPGDPKPVEVDTDTLRKIEDDAEPAAAKQKAPLDHPGAPGGTGGTTREQDDRA